MQIVLVYELSIMASLAKYRIANECVAKGGSMMLPPPFATQPLANLTSAMPTGVTCLPCVSPMSTIHRRQLILLTPAPVLLHIDQTQLPQKYAQATMKLLVPVPDPPPPPHTHC